MTVVEEGTMMAQTRDVAHYTGEAGRTGTARDSRVRATDILGRCFVDRVGAWISPDEKVIEFGCGNGRNILAIRCRERAGYDVNEHSRAAAAAAGLRVYHSTDDIPRGYWDAVVCHHVLEHVAAQAATLQLLKSLLAAGGRLILTVPVEGHLLYMRSAENDIDRHLYCWNPATIRNLLDVAGAQGQKSRDPMGRVRESRAAVGTSVVACL